MSKKKKTKSSRIDPFFKTRKGFYLLSFTAILLMFVTLKLFVAQNSDENVLGRNSGEGENTNKSEEQKIRHEEKKEELRKEFRINPEEIQVKFDNEKGNLKRKIETKTIPPQRVKMEDDDEEDLMDAVEEEFSDENETEIASEGGETTVKTHKTKARTGFPLSVDVATNQLIITRPDGTTKNVAVLPDQAVQNFMRHKKVNLINVDDNTGSGSASTEDATSSPTLDQTGDETQVSLIEKDHELVYEIKGKKKLKVLGFIPVNTDTKGYVSAESGEVVSQEESLFTKFLNFMSF